MRVENLPDLNPPDFGNVCDPHRPVLSFAWQAPAAHRAAAHRHARAHIIQPTAGAYCVDTPDGTWLVPTGRAIWIPPQVHHEVYSHGPVSARVLFVDPAAAAPLPQRSGVVVVSPLLAGLLQRALEHGNDYSPDGPAARLATVALDELAAMRPAPLLLPLARDPRLVRVMAELLEDPNSHTDIGRSARAAGASQRTMARLFRRETGLSFAQWKARLLLVESVKRLERGDRVSDIANDLGFGGTSSFVYMFRRQMGVSPGRYGADRPV